MGKTYPVIFGTPNSKFNRRQAIQSICEIVGWECWSTPVGLLFFTSQIQADRTSTIRFKRGELLQSWIDPFTLLANHKVEKISVAGHNIGDLMATGSAQVGGYGVGSREATINLRHIKTNAACSEAATALLADWQNDVYTGRFEAIDTFDGHAYDVGDLIKVVDDDFDVDGDYRISSIERWFDAEHVETTRLGITNISKLTLNGPYLLEPGEKAIIDSYMGVDELGKIHHFADTRTLTQWLIKHVFHESFEKVDTDIWTEAGTGTIIATSEGGLPCVKFTTPAAGAGFCSLKSTTAYWGNANWQLCIKMKTNTNDKILFMIGAHITDDDYMAFYYDKDVATVFRAICVASASGTSVDLTPVDFTSYHEFLIERLSASKACFWIDGVLQATITTDVPSTDMQYCLYFQENEAVAKEGYIRSITAQEI